MAKNTPRANAFGIMPDSFETTKKQQPVEEAIEVVIQNEPAVSVPEQKKVIYSRKERNTVRVHFKAKESLMMRVDAFQEASGMTRTEIMEAALNLFLDSVEQ